MMQFHFPTPFTLYLPALLLQHSVTGNTCDTCLYLGPAGMYIPTPYRCAWGYLLDDDGPWTDHSILDSCWA